MPTISMSPVLFSAHQTLMFTHNAVHTLGTYNTSGLMSDGSAISSTYSAVNFCIMKGTVPTDFSTLTSYAARSADILVNYGVVSAGTSTHFSTSSNFASAPAVITSDYKAAAATGTATWFWWMVRPHVSNAYSGNTIYHQIIGTVGDLGSGADLEIPSTTITSGQQVRVYNLRINFPRTFTY